MNEDYLQVKRDYIHAVKNLAETLESILEDVEPSGAPDAFDENHNEYLERHKVLVETAECFKAWLENPDDEDSEESL